MRDDRLTASTRRRTTQRMAGALLVLAIIAAAPPAAAARPPVSRASAPQRLDAAATVTTSGSGVEPLVPHRLLDTRDGTGAPKGPVGAGGVVELEVAGRGGVPAVGAGAVVLNVVATEATADTYVTVFPTGVPVPLAANLNVRRGQTVPNLVVAKVGQGGKVSLYNFAGSTHLVADVQGWFPESADIRPMTPTRLLDTRDGTGTPQGRVGPGGVVRLQISGQGGIPATGVGAVVMNVAVTNPSQPSFLTVYPGDVERPLAANLNFVAGQTVPNLVIAKVSSEGAVDIYNYAGRTDIVADVAGWFPTGSGFEGVTPNRVLDTRDGTGAPAGPVPGGSSVSLQVTGRGGVPTDGVAAVVLNVAVTGPTESSFVTVSPTGVERPLAANLNFVAGQTVPNLVIAKVGAGGKVDLFNYAGSTHLVADVTGWFREAPDGDGTTLSLRAGTALAGAGDVISVSGSAAVGGSVVLAGSADVPAVGGHLAVSPQPAAPDGFFGKVTAVAANSDGTKTVTVVPGSIEEGFADVEASYHGDVPAGVLHIDDDDLIVPGGLGADRAPDRRVPGGPTLSTSCETTSGATISPTLTLGAGELSWELRLAERYVHFELPLTATLGFSAILSGSVSCTFALLPVTIPLGPLGTLDLTPELTVSATAEISASATLTADLKFGFEVDGGRTVDLSYFRPTRTGDASAGATVTLSARPSLKSAIKLFGLAGGFVDIGVTIKAVYSLAELPCLWISAQHSIDFGFEVGRWGIEWSVTLASITGPEHRFYERSDICPATSFMSWIGDISVSSNRAQATQVFRNANGEVVATYTSRKSFSYSIVSSQQNLVNTDVRSTESPSGMVVSFPALVDSSEYRDASPPSSCSDFTAHRGTTPWQVVTSLARDPVAGDQVVDPQDGEAVYLYIAAYLPTEVRCSGGEVVVALAPLGGYNVGDIYDNEFTCLSPAVEAGERGACYLPVTVSEGGTRLRFDGTLSGTWDQFGFPVPMTQTVHVDLHRIATPPG